MKNVTLDINIPSDARKFIKDAMKEVFNGASINVLQLENGSEVKIENLTDSQAVQYAWELLPLFQAKFPDNCDITMEH